MVMSPSSKNAERPEISNTEEQDGGSGSHIDVDNDDDEVRLPENRTQLMVSGGRRV